MKKLKTVHIKLPELGNLNNKYDFLKARANADRSL